MKSLLLTLAFTIVGSFGHAQMTEGYIKFNVKVSSEEPGMAMAVAMMQDANMIVYFNESAVRSEVDMGISQQIAMFDVTTDSMLMLMDMLGKKLAIPMSVKEITESTGETPKYSISVKKKEQKEIAGHKCTKAIVSDEEGNEVEVWYTEKIKPPFNKATSADGWQAELPGYALEYSTVQNNIEMHYIATEVSDEVDTSLLKLAIPDGYEKVSLEELEEKIGGANH